jgi:hypothetical protein
MIQSGIFETKIINKSDHIQLRSYSRLCSAQKNFHASQPCERAVLGQFPMEPTFKIPIVNILIHKHPDCIHKSSYSCYNFPFFLLSKELMDRTSY